MNDSKVFLYIAIAVIGGIGIGWLIKPQTIHPDQHDHHQDYKEMQVVADEIWTCSMHPQIRQNEPGLCPICKMDLIPLTSNNLNNDPSRLEMSAAAIKLAQIETTLVGSSAQQGVKASINVDGSVELDESSLKSQTAHVSGRLESLLINYEGMYVRTGQKIGQIYSTELLAASQELITAAQFEDQVQGLKEASIQKLKNWKITDEQIERILQTAEPITTIDLFADHAGFVTKKILNQGDYVRAGQPIYQVGSTGRLWLNFNVFESDLAQVQRGQTIEFKTPSLPGRSFEAKITFIDPLLNAASRTATIRASINNPNNSLKPGMLLTGSIHTQTSGSNTKLSIPRSAVLWTGKTSVVYVKVPDVEVPTFQYQNVVIDDENSNEYVTVLEGLDAAAQLNNKSSMINGLITTGHESKSYPNYHEEVTRTFLEHLSALTFHYLEVKDALIESDLTLTSKAAASLLEELILIKTDSIDGEILSYWINLKNAIQDHGSAIVGAATIEVQRKQFEFLSDTFIEALKVFGVNTETFYVQYCPMAFENQGADWISNVSDIQNPYFGESMLTCGIVTDSIKAN